MTTDPPLLTADARRTAKRWLDVLKRERIVHGAAATDSAAPALIEQAKGALMLHYGVDSHQAFGMLVGWSRVTRTPVPTIAHTLLRGICEGSPQVEVRQRPLLRWLEEQLRDGEPGRARLRAAPTRRGPAPETSRSG